MSIISSKIYAVMSGSGSTDLFLYKISLSSGETLQILKLDAYTDSIFGSNIKLFGNNG
jgi:hypothetical protein